MRTTMSRTALPDGTVRYAPNRGHRGRRPSRRATATALAYAVPLGVAGFAGVGPGPGLPIAAVTAAVTLLAVLVWRLTVPRMLSVTASPTELTFKSYGRTTTVQVNERTTAAARLVVDGYGFESRYVVITGDGGQFKLNADMWTDDDLAALASGKVHWATEPAAVTVKEFDSEFPGLLPGHVAHPNRFAAGFIVVALAVIIGVGATIGGLKDRDSDPDTEPTTAEPTRAQQQDLNKEDARTQNRLQSDVQRLLGDDNDWSPAAPEVRDCADLGGYQRFLTWTNNNPRSTYPQNVREQVTAAAAAANLDAADLRVAGDTIDHLLYVNVQTAANLTVTLKNGELTVQTASACSGNK
jgi:hypothetical protein